MSSTQLPWSNNVSNFDYIVNVENDQSWSSSLYKTILQGNWEGVLEILKEKPEAITARLSAFSETPIVVAVKGKIGLHFMKKMVDLMPAETLALPDYFGNTALHAVAVLGSIQVAKMFVKKNSDLPNIWNNDGFLPVHVAAMQGQREMTLYLFSVTREEEDESGATLMRFAMNAGIYDLALHLLQHNPRLAWQDTFSPLEAMAQEPSAFPSGIQFNIFKSLIYYCSPLKSTKIPQSFSQDDLAGHEEVLLWRCYKLKRTRVFLKFNALFWKFWEILFPPVKRISHTKLMNCQALGLVRLMCSEIKSLDPAKATSVLRGPFLLAAQNGIHEIVKEILESFPHAITFMDDENRTALHLAVMYRQVKIFQVMHQYSGQYKMFLPLLLDNRGNNILHLVGYKAYQHQLDIHSGAILQMQRELQWYKEVEKFVRPEERKSENSYGKTPIMVFNEEHRELVAQEGQWMIGMATSCTVAASLIATVVFAAAITVPGGTNINGLPIFSQQKGFIIFAISDACSLLASITTVLAFLSIFTSRYAVNDFLHALPARLIIGLISLFLSVTSMMIAFTAAVYLNFTQKNTSLIVPIAAFSCLPVILFSYLQLPPLIDMIRSTYGPSIFG